MKAIAINCSPRVNQNTDMMVSAALKGCVEACFETEHYNLYQNGRFTGCLSCFGCKRAPHEGECIVNDGMKEILTAIKEADVVIFGTPNYLGDVSAGFRSLFERLQFSNLTYQKEQHWYNTYDKEVLLIMSSNASEEWYDQLSYTDVLKKYKMAFESWLGHTEVLIAGNTLQVDDYSKYNWTMFDPEKKKESRAKQFPKDLEKAEKSGLEAAGKAASKSR